jgi:transcriptional regulator NrdR family protein
MKCPKCQEKLKVNKTVNLDSPMTVRYYTCPSCKTTYASTEKLDKKFPSQSDNVDGVRSVNA